MVFAAVAFIMFLYLLQDDGIGGLLANFVFFCLLGIAWEHYNPGALVAFAAFLKGAL